MRQITIRLREEVIESLEAEAEEKGVSRSEHIRDVIASREEVEELQTEVERLRNQHALLLEERQEKTELVEYVEEEQAWRSAPIWDRAKWWVLGKD